MRLNFLPLVLFAALCACLPATAAESLVIRADHASARSFAADAAKLFQLKHRVTTRVEAVGTMSALEAVATGEVPIAIVARAGDGSVEAEAGLRYVPIAWDALVFVAHARNPVATLSLPQARDALAGTTRDWQALGGKPGAINVYTVAAPMDGVEYSLKRLVFGTSRAQFAAGRWYLNTERLEEAVSIDPVGLGVSLQSDVLDNKGLRILALDGVAPSPAALADGRYPLAMALQAALRADAPAGSPGVRFLEFLGESEVDKRLRARNLVPAKDARDIADASGAREAVLASRLGYELPTVAVVPPPPPPPKKSFPTNATRLAKVDTTHPAFEKQPGGKGDAQLRTTLAQETVKPRACLEEAPPCS